MWFDVLNPHNQFLKFVIQQTPNFIHYCEGLYVYFLFPS